MTNESESEMHGRRTQTAAESSTLHTRLLFPTALQTLGNCSVMRIIHEKIGNLQLNPISSDAFQMKNDPIGVILAPQRLVFGRK